MNNYLTDKQPEKIPVSEEIIQIEETEWSGYFDGINGAAVIYDPSENRYQIYKFLL